MAGVAAAWHTACHQRYRSRNAAAGELRDTALLMYLMFTMLLINHHEHNNCVSITISLTANNSQKPFLGFLSFPVSYKLYISCVLTFLPFTSYLFFYWQWIWTKNGCEEMMMINNLEYMHLLVYIWLICHYCHQVHSTFSNYFVKLKHQHRGLTLK